MPHGRQWASCHVRRERYEGIRPGLTFCLVLLFGTEAAQQEMLYRHHGVLEGFSQLVSAFVCAHTCRSDVLGTIAHTKRCTDNRVTVS
jgi:hypothetical protein